jgi:hypothetical protein
VYFTGWTFVPSGFAVQTAWRMAPGLLVCAGFGQRVAKNANSVPSGDHVGWLTAEHGETAVALDEAA